MLDLITLKENPELAKNLTFTLNGNDLLNFAESLIGFKTQVIEPPKEPDTLMTIDETAEFLKVSRVSLWQWEKKGILIPLKVGSLSRYRKSDVLATLEKRNR